MILSLKPSLSLTSTITGQNYSKTLLVIVAAHSYYLLIHMSTPSFG